MRGIKNLNKKLVVEKVKPFLTQKNSITKNVFQKVFIGTSQLDLVEIVNILGENSIFVDITEAI